MKKIAAILLTFILLSSTVSCSSDVYAEKTFECMDTFCTVKLSSPDSEKLLEECESLLSGIEKEIDAYDENSSVYIFNESGSVSSKTLAELFEISYELKQKTKGNFSPSLGSVVSLWKDGEKTGNVPGENALKKAVSSSGKSVSVVDGVLKKEDPDTRLDFGGIAKGYAADKAVEFLKEKGVGSALISFSSTVAALGLKNGKDPWNIAIKSPSGNGNIGNVKLKDGEFLSISGNYERFISIGGNDYCHIISPFDGMPVSSNLCEVAVICKSGAESDALSTALFVMGKDSGSIYCEENGITAMFVTLEGSFFCGDFENRFTPVK